MLRSPRFALLLALFVGLAAGTSLAAEPFATDAPALDEVADPPAAVPTAADQRAVARQMLARWQSDPVLFAREVLGVESWDRQAEVMSAVTTHGRVAVRSGHKVGKSTSAAALSLWWVTTRPRATVVMTSSSYRQVKGILWKELKRLHREARFPLGGKLADDPETGLQFTDGREVVGLSTKEPERIAGYSGANLLFILDEASGIPEPIFEAIEGNRAGGARLAMFSNPTKTSGTFFDAFNSKRNFWRTLHISSEETPNARLGRMVVPGLANAEWVAEKKQEWGEDSPLYQVRVRGNFPSQAENAVIALFLVEQARARWDDDEAEGDERVPVPQDGPLALGVDVARFGDDETVIAPRRGLKVLPLRATQGKDTTQVAGLVRQVARELRRPGERVKVNVDTIGVGAGVADQLRQDPDLEVADINVAEAATAEGYARLRDQLWGATRDWLKAGGALPPDPKLEAELVAPVYSFDARGRMVVESKDSMKKRLQRSPDRADALALAVYEPPAVAEFEPIFGTSRWS